MLVETNCLLSYSRFYKREAKRHSKCFINRNQPHDTVLTELCNCFQKTRWMCHKRCRLDTIRHKTITAPFPVGHSCTITRNKVTLKTVTVDNQTRQMRFIFKKEQLKLHFIKSAKNTRLGMHKNCDTLVIPSTARERKKAIKWRQNEKLYVLWPFKPFSSTRWHVPV